MQKCFQLYGNDRISLKQPLLFYVTKIMPGYDNCVTSELQYCELTNMTNAVVVHITV